MYNLLIWIQPARRRVVFDVGETFWRTLLELEDETGDEAEVEGLDEEESFDRVETVRGVLLGVTEKQFVHGCIEDLHSTTLTYG